MPYQMLHIRRTGHGRARQWILLILASMTMVACSGANDGRGPSTGPKEVQPAPTGSVKVTVIDFTGEPVRGATVSLNDFRNVRFMHGTDQEGIAQFDNIPAGTLHRVCAWHTNVGRDCSSVDSTVVIEGTTVSVALEMQPLGPYPLGVVAETAVDAAGLSTDGRMLDFRLRLVADEFSADNWFLDNAYVRVIPDCIARTGQQLADEGPGCIRNPAGTDGSYTFDSIINSPVATTAIQLSAPATVGLLIDASAPADAADKVLSESRMTALKWFAHKVLPDTPMLLAAFAADDAQGSNPSQLTASPVALFPLDNPGLLVNEPEVGSELDGLLELAGGVSPMYSATLATIDLLADYAVPGTRRVLVVIAGGRDDICASPAECHAIREAIAARAKDRNVQIVLLATGSDQSSHFAFAHDTSALLIEYAGQWADGLGLVRGLLGEPVSIVDVRLRLKSDEPGAFYPGAVVTGEFRAFNQGACPFDCMIFSWPFSVSVQ